MFWFGLFVKYVLPLLLKKEAITFEEAEAIKAIYWAKTNIKTYSNNDELHPENSDFPSEKGRDHM